VRRNWVVLDKRLTSCVVLDRHGNVRHKLCAYELYCARTANACQLNAYYVAPGPLGVETARRIRQALYGECCYAFYCKVTHSVKLGRTSDLFARWAKLENQGGRPLQLVAVWQASDCCHHERGLHERFSECRRLGEWFAAEPVLSALRAIAS
jgi:hypothetical protein